MECYFAFDEFVVFEVFDLFLFFGCDLFELIESDFSYFLVFAHEVVIFGLAVQSLVLWLLDFKGIQYIFIILGFGFPLRWRHDLRLTIFTFTIPYCPRYYFSTLST